MQVMSVRQAFDGRDVRPFSLLGQTETGESWFTIDENSTTSTGPHVASALDSESTCLITKDIEKDGVTLDEMLVCLVVDICLPSLLPRTGEHGDSNMDGHGERGEPITGDL